MSKLLAFDTTTEACSVALYNNGEMTELYELCRRQHGDLILEMINSLLKTQNLALEQLDALAFSHGPGSFTGIRIATNVMQALAFATQLPVVSVSTLQAMAYRAYTESDAEYVIAAIDARMAEVYFAAYHIQTAVVDDCVISPKALPDLPAEKWFGVGNAWSVYQEAFLEKYGQDIQYNKAMYPHAASIALLAEAAYQKGHTMSYREIMPNYIRNKVTN